MGVPTVRRLRSRETEGEQMLDKINDDQILDLLVDLDTEARSIDDYYYGLPSYSVEDSERLIATFRKWLARLHQSEAEVDTNV